MHRNRLLVLHCALHPASRRHLTCACMCLLPAPQVGNAVSALGSLLMAQGQVSEAERALRFALRLQSKGLGVAHPAVVTTGEWGCWC